MFQTGLRIRMESWLFKLLDPDPDPYSSLNMFRIRIQLLKLRYNFKKFSKKHSKNGILKFFVYLHMKKHFFVKSSLLLNIIQISKTNFNMFL
jgi:hypothetical protein